jgi:pimeloyl-ACP methyl ester carboxylesterase
MTELPPLEHDVLPSGVRSRFVHDINGLRLHVLEAGFETCGRPLVLLLHGFPELAYSWRKVMLPLAAAGYRVAAPDQRGYGRTTGWDAEYDGDLGSFRILNAVRDALGLVSALGYREVALVAGHDFGASVAAWCALVRPDVFRSVALMSAPFAGPPALPFDTADNPPQPKSPDNGVHDELAKLDRPRKHYQWYYSTRPADADMWRCPQGVHAFLRGYFHYKSADWEGNKPFPLKSWTAGELAKMPTYYIMDLQKNMAETVAPEMPSAAEIASCQWLPENELRVYSTEYERTGFQGGLQWYRARTQGLYDTELQLFSGRTIDVPSMFIAGKSDWGTYQRPGSFERMQQSACTRMLGCHLIDGAGHWVQQEQPERVGELLLGFTQTVRLRADA